MSLINSTRAITFCILLSAALLLAASADAQTTQFTYQGKLSDASSPANGSYDFQFKLFDAMSGGAQQGGVVSADSVQVSDGIFTVQLDFGAGVFPGANRYIEMAVKPTSGSTFTTLNPRLLVTANPYAIHSLNATAADGLSVACVNCVTSAQIQSVQGSQVSGTLPVASIPAGSGNYIQNTASQQAGATFNISGSGTAAGTFSGNVVNATTQYNIGGNLVLTTDALFNSFAGVQSGTLNNSGNNNSFFGFRTGNQNQTGGNNSFFGSQAGFANTASNNSFFGMLSGNANTIGSGNSFFGNQSGRTNTNGNRNSFFGDGAGSNNTTGFNNNFFGGDAGLSNTTGEGNSFFGTAAGTSNNADANSFFGNFSGQSNTSGNGNSFFGFSAGRFNTTANNNSFFGFNAGNANTIGHDNLRLLDFRQEKATSATRMILMETITHSSAATPVKPTPDVATPSLALDPVNIP